MEWVLDHLRLIFVIGGGIAWWLNQRKQVQTGEKAPPPPEATFDDPELAERTRKIREEIQRKIEQRARGYANEQPELPHNEPAEPPPVIREVVVTRHPVRAASRMEARQQAEMLEQQAALVEKLREAELMKASVQRRRAFEESTADHTVEVQAVIRSAVLDDLHSPAALRRAFILREVLGPPVALRR